MSDGHTSGWGERFEPDSARIRWPDSCAEEGADRPLGYHDGIVRESGDREFETWLIWGCFAFAVVCFIATGIWPCWWGCD